MLEPGVSNVMWHSVQVYHKDLFYLREELGMILIEPFEAITMQFCCIKFTKFRRHATYCVGIGHTDRWIVSMVVQKRGRIQCGKGMMMMQALTYHHNRLCLLSLAA